MSAETIVVTGGAGFIGSRLCLRLCDLGYSVTILDNLSTGQLDRLKPMLEHSGARFVQGDIRDKAILERIISGADYLYHLAASISVAKSIVEPLTTLDVNASATLEILRLAAKYELKKVVLASSAAVYGDVELMPVNEQTALNPLSPYAISKVIAEQYAQLFNDFAGMPTVILRFFNVYGPGQDSTSEYSSVIPKFIHRVTSGQPPIIFGDGEQTRDFVHVDDVVSATILALGENARGVFNVGSGEAATLNHLTWLLLDITGNSLSPVYEAERLGDIRHSVADINKVRNIGYMPVVELRSGLEQMVASLLNQRSSAS
ncbi:UDP-glucose 4-epimerase [Dehalogenimonas formicexedens]|uniref:UDP-glucose 4-epimerase n=1 Tax=Dehalogenimonas formicexedens TaxID=1839801 RepID=A0A1P8F9K4_9CHLR|nr:NAD-dependent epimerase/dehydratase family protein [Dehalogenimonas formicexedens]APV45151.1 UDP-glucose 4-epimerase [Dehalogenimonas formicexedens]